MGNASSASRASQALDEDAAFAIATTWRAKLRDWITLTTTDEYGREPVAFIEASHRIHRHFTWVQAGLPGIAGDLETPVEGPSAAARVSAIVWQALANCPGYSGRENPRFWKRVFSAIWGDRREQMIADDVGFFEDDDWPFPCVRIRPRLGQEERTLRAFFAPASIDRELRPVLQQLEPYIANADWWRRDIPLEIVGIDFHVIERSRPNFYVPKRRPMRNLPMFRLVAVRMSKNYYGLSDTAVKTLAAAKNVTLHVGHCYLDDKTKHTLASTLAQPTWRRSERLRIETIRPKYSPPGEDPAFAGICSALPHTRTIQALELKGDYNASELDDIRAAWLGYALFHPDTRTQSSLTALELGLPHVRSSVIDILKTMATGNNLLFVLGVTMTVSNAYYEAQVAAGTNVFAETSAKSSILSSFPDEATVTLCIASLQELHDLSWIRVVVPGVGLGWIPTPSILTTIARPPGASSLCRLDLSEHRDHQGYLETVIVDTLDLLGRSLTHLKIRAALSSSVFQSVLQTCPHLLALSVVYNGECWSDPALLPLMPSTPRLRTLELLISAPLQPLVAPQLEGLTCFRVIDQDQTPTPFSVHRDALLTILAQYPRLSHVYWSSRRLFPSPWWESSGYLPWWTPSLAVRVHNWQASSYGLLGENIRGVLDVAEVPLSYRAKVAFLSVLTASPTLPHLSPELLRLVFAYGADVIPRQLHIRAIPEDT